MYGHSAGSETGCSDPFDLRSALWGLGVECREDVDMKTVFQGKMS